MTHMRRGLLIALLVMIAVTGPLAGRRRSSKDVRRERQRTEQQISRTQGRIKTNQEETRRQLNRLTSLEAQISLRNDTVSVLQARLDSLNREMTVLNDSITRLEARTRALKASYARTLRSIRARRQGMSELAFVFSAETFGQAWRRIRYLREMARCNTEQARRIGEASARLADARGALEELRSRQAADLARIEGTRRTLLGQRQAADALVGSLRREGRSLTRELERRRSEMQALDRELDKIIEREMREAEERRRREAEEAERRRREEEQRRREEARRQEEERRREQQREQTDDKTPAKPSKETAPAPPPAPKPSAPAPAAPAFASEAAADRALTGSFKANKGRLLFPVSGRYTIISNFGTNTHPELSKVKIDNLGIDIEVPAGTGARAVYQGVVSSIFRLEGYHNIVIVRHGEYLTVYGGLDKLSVKKGDKVKAGQSLGTIYVDRDDDNRARLHFEIRLEKKKLNPVEWVR